MEWHPIETAPHDRPILVFNALTGTYRSQWDGSQFPFFGWNGKPGTWYPKPTLWMELPEPPNPQGFLDSSWTKMKRPPFGGLHI